MIVEPWKQIDHCTSESIRKLARLLMAKECDDNGRIVRNAFGNTGHAVGSELLAFAEYKEGKTERKQQAKEKKEQKREASPHHATAVKIVNLFEKTYKKVLESPPPNWNFAYGIKLTTKLLEEGWDPFDLEYLVSYFIGIGYSLKDKSHEIAFGTGDYYTFTKNISKLRRMAIKEGKLTVNKKPAMPESMKNKFKKD